MERIVVNTIRKTNTPFIQNATTLVTEYPPFLPYFDFRKGFVKYITDDDILSSQCVSDEGYENPYYSIRSMLIEYGNLIAAYKITASFRLKLERKTGSDLDYIEGYTPTEEDIKVEDEKEKHKCPECQAIIDAINAGKKAIGNINLNNTAISDPYALLTSKNKSYEIDVEVSLDNKNFNLVCAEGDILWDKFHKITALTVKTFKVDTNAVKNYLNNITEYIKETMEDQVTGKYNHYLLEYAAETVTNKIELLCYKVSPAELGSLLEGELRIAPIHKTETDILWIPIRYTKQPFMNAIRGKGRTTDISENYVDTVIGNIRIKKEDRVNNLEYVEHHNEIKWLEKVGFSATDKKEILLYIK